MRIIHRNKEHAFVPVSKEFGWVLLRLQVVPKMRASKASFEQAYLEQLIS